MNRRTAWTRSAAALCAAGLLLSPLPVLAAPGENDLDLIGTWFVLIHYRDSMTANPDADRWEDKVWTFEDKGSRLQWREFPIVVFNDGSGRFGRVGRNPRARMLHNWEPNDAQMAEIQKGPQVNSRGSKTKTLRGSLTRGYKSRSVSRSVSAMTIGYQETWSIDDPQGLPVFTRDDALGMEAELATQGAGVVSGRTRYTTRKVLEGGNVLQGSYARDENKKGSFRLIRAGAVRGLESDGRTPNQKQRERSRELLRAGMADAAYSAFLQSLGDDQVRDLRDQIGEEELSRIWTKYEKRFIAGDESAREEIARDLREAYAASLESDLSRLRESAGDALLSGEQQAVDLDPKQRALLEKVRQRLGEEKIASLRARYGERIQAGDAKARAELRNEIRDAYLESAREDFARRQREATARAAEAADRAR